MDNAGLWSIVPPLVGIALALITREIILSLFTAIISGAVIHLCFVGGDSVAAFKVFVDLTSGKMAENMPMIMFLCLLGSLVSVVTYAGGARAYGEWAFKKLKRERTVNLMTVVMGLVIFIDDYFNCLTVGTVMRPVTDKFRISRAKLAYFIDTTAAPVCILSPISSWAAYVISCLPKDMQADGFRMYLCAAPLNFYAILSLVLVFWVALKPNLDFGLMRRMERTAHKCRDVSAEVVMREDLDRVPVSSRGRVLDLIFPIFSLIGLSAWLLSRYDAGVALALSALIALVITFVFLMVRRALDYHQFAAAVLFGIKTMVPALVLLALAWGISAVCNDLLGTGQYLASLIVNQGISIRFLPVTIFAIAAVFAFATGTSWAPVGIFVPIGMSVCQAVDPSTSVLTLAATLSGSVMGDHCSPISDTTILSSTGAQCKHINHVMTQIPYAAVAGGASVVLYTLIGLYR